MFFPEQGYGNFRLATRIRRLPFVTFRRQLLHGIVNASNWCFRTAPAYWARSFRNDRSKSDELKEGLLCGVKILRDALP
jgi:hypothetical protein